MVPFGKPKSLNSIDMLVIESYLTSSTEFQTMGAWISNELHVTTIEISKYIVFNL